jgi:hypothetical protein
MQWVHVLPFTLPLIGNIDGITIKGAVFLYDNVPHGKLKAAGVTGGFDGHEIPMDHIKKCTWVPILADYPDLDRCPYHCHEAITWSKWLCSPRCRRISETWILQPQVLPHIGIPSGYDILKQLYSRSGKQGLEVSRSNGALGKCSLGDKAVKNLLDL